MTTELGASLARCSTKSRRSLIEDAVEGSAAGRLPQTSGASDLPRDAVAVGAPAEAWAESVVVEWRQHGSPGAEVPEELVDFVRRVTRHKDRHRRREAEFVRH